MSTKDRSKTMVVVIATHGRDTLLERTLRSIAEAERPASLREIVVVENGGKGDAGDVVARLGDVLPLRYAYSDPANKSQALNSVLRDLTNELVVFFDDDIRVAPTTLTAYDEAMQKGEGKRFFGGRCEIDYEEAPPDWLRPYLPGSVVGFSLGEEMCDVDDRVFLGCNWAAFAGDLHERGGFDLKRGPGTDSRGQESDMQHRLFAAGFKGRYLPGATVWHYVPRDRCTPEWALNRAEETWVIKASVLARRSPLQRAISYNRQRLRTLKAWTVLRLFGEKMSQKHRFMNEYKLRVWAGMTKGMNS